MRFLLWWFQERCHRCFISGEMKVKLIVPSSLNPAQPLVWELSIMYCCVCDHNAMLQVQKHQHLSGNIFMICSMYWVLVTNDTFYTHTLLFFVWLHFGFYGLIVNSLPNSHSVMIWIYSTWKTGLSSGSFLGTAYITCFTAAHTQLTTYTFKHSRCFE